MAKSRNRHKHRGFRFSVPIVMAENGPFFLQSPFHSAKRVSKLRMEAGEIQKCHDFFAEVQSVDMMGSFHPGSIFPLTMQSTPRLWKGRRSRRRESL